jgi:hypothetical protein
MDHDISMVGLTGPNGNATQLNEDGGTNRLDDSLKRAQRQNITRQRRYRAPYSTSIQQILGR